MTTARFTGSHILAIPRSAQGGLQVLEVCLYHGMSSATLYKWRAKVDGVEASLMKRIKELKDEIRRHKKMCTDERLVC